jgi:MoxR-like ATPase
MAAAAPKTEILFVKSKAEQNKVVYLPLPRQKVTQLIDGAVKEVDPTFSVTIRTPIKGAKAGIIYASNQLTRKEGYYVAGGKFVQITDETGKLFQPTGSDTFTDDSIAAYAKYLRNETEDDAPAVGKEKRTPILTLLKSDSRYAPPTIAGDGYYVDPEIWYLALRNMLARRNILFLGDTGCGKTELVQLICRKIGKELEMFDMAISNPTTTLCGNQRINKDGVSEYQYARFATKLRGYTPDGENVSKGYAILLDELSRAHPMAANILLPLLDNRRTLAVENAMEESQIKAHEDTVFWATANVGMQYAGTSALDLAIMDRFTPLHIPYMPEDKEVQVLVKRTDCLKSEATAIVDFANKTRENRELVYKVSTRQTLAMAGLVYDGYSVAQAAEYEVLNRYQGDEHDGGEKGQVKALIQQIHN